MSYRYAVTVDPQFIEDLMQEVPRRALKRLAAKWKDKLSGLWGMPNLTHTNWEVHTRPASRPRSSVRHPPTDQNRRR